MGVKKKKEIPGFCSYCSRPLNQGEWLSGMAHSLCALYELDRHAKIREAQDRMYAELLDRALDES